MPRPQGLQSIQQRRSGEHTVAFQLVTAPVEERACKAGGRDGQEKTGGGRADVGLGAARGEGRPAACTRHREPPC
jgi:hypothetical protein